MFPHLACSLLQIAYLENLLKVYNDEIRRLQEKELSLDDLMAEDSGYIQEHKLKGKVSWSHARAHAQTQTRKRLQPVPLCPLSLLQMMKIYDKLCELKGCNTLTGRVMEQRISFSGTRYPEINKKVKHCLLLYQNMSDLFVGFQEKPSQVKMDHLL